MHTSWAHVHEEHAGDETEALTVARLHVRDGVAMEDVGQRALASSHTHQTEVGVRRKGPTCIIKFS